MTTYTKRGLGEGGPGLQALFAQIDPDRDNGPNEGLSIEFENGVTLSIIWGWGTYATPTTVEVAVIGEEGEWLTGEVAEVAFGEDLDDAVDGFCDAARVHGYFVTAQGWGKA